MIKQLSDKLYIGGNFLRIVQLYGSWLVVDQTGIVVRTKDSKEDAIEFAKSLYMRSPTVYPYHSKIYVGRIMELRYTLGIGYIISKGAEILYIIEDEADALERLGAL